MSTTRRQDHVQRAVPQTTQCRKDEYVLVTPVSQATTQETDVCVLSILTPGVQGRGEPHALVPLASNLSAPPIQSLCISWGTQSLGVGVGRAMLI